MEDAKGSGADTSSFHKIARSLDGTHNNPKAPSASPSKGRKASAPGALSVPREVRENIRN